MKKKNKLVETPQSIILMIFATILGMILFFMLLPIILILLIISRLIGNTNILHRSFSFVCFLVVYIVVLCYEVLFRKKFVMEGVEKIDFNKKIVFVSSHTSGLDIFLLTKILLLKANITYISKKELRVFYPMYLYAILSGAVILIDRSQKMETIKYMMRMSEQKLNKRYIICAFAEGKRVSEVGSIGCKSGVYALVKYNNRIFGKDLQVLVIGGSIKKDIEQNNKKISMRIIDTIDPNLSKDDFLNEVNRKIIQ